MATSHVSTAAAATSTAAAATVAAAPPGVRRAGPARAHARGRARRARRRRASARCRGPRPRPPPSRPSSPRCAPSRQVPRPSDEAQGGDGKHRRRAGRGAQRLGGPAPAVTADLSPPGGRQRQGADHDREDGDGAGRHSKLLRSRARWRSAASTGRPPFGRLRRGGPDERQGGCGAQHQALARAGPLRRVESGGVKAGGTGPLAQPTPEEGEPQPQRTPVRRRRCPPPGEQLLPIAVAPGRRVPTQQAAALRRGQHGATPSPSDGAPAGSRPSRSVASSATRTRSTTVAASWSRPASVSR